MAENGFNFQKLIADTKSVLLSPKEYFVSMEKEGGYVEPVIKAVIYGLVGGIISFIWGILGLSALGAVIGVITIILTPIYALIGIFIGGVILLVISAICSGDTNYETNVRVAASLSALTPVYALLGFTYGINLTLGSIISLIIALYGIWLLYNALIHALNCKESIAKIISIILAILPVIFILSTLVCVKTTSLVSEKYIEQMQKSGEEMKATEKKMKEMMEELTKKKRSE
ncbi:MAG: YIP1 family protein [Spirochaetota bacterium]|nr:YIP1 family protein [Spirochaetota bacterium]